MPLADTIERKRRLLNCAKDSHAILESVERLRKELPDADSLNAIRTWMQSAEGHMSAAINSMVKAADA